MTAQICNLAAARATAQACGFALLRCPKAAPIPPALCPCKGGQRTQESCCRQLRRCCPRSTPQEPPGEWLAKGVQRNLWLGPLAVPKSSLLLLTAAPTLPALYPSPAALGGVAHVRACNRIALCCICGQQGRLLPVNSVQQQMKNIQKRRLYERFCNCRPAPGFFGG